MGRSTIVGDDRVDEAACNGMNVGGECALSAERKLIVADRMAKMVSCGLPMGILGTREEGWKRQPSPNRAAFPQSLKRGRI